MECLIPGIFILFMQFYFTCPAHTCPSALTAVINNFNGEGDAYENY